MQPVPMPPVLGIMSTRLACTGELFGQKFKAGGPRSCGAIGLYGRRCPGVCEAGEGCRADAPTAGSARKPKERPSKSQGGMPPFAA